MTVRDRHHQRFHQEIFWEKLTNLSYLTFATITRDFRRRRDSPRGNLTPFSCLCVSSVRPCRREGPLVRRYRPEGLLRTDRGGRTAAWQNGDAGALPEAAATVTVSLSRMPLLQVLQLVGQARDSFKFGESDRQARTAPPEKRLQFGGGSTF